MLGPWASNFLRWYNVDHRHSGIRYVSPAQRHAGDDHAILAARHALYVQARERNPARWSRDTHNWTPIGAVTLNPERDSVVAMATRCRRYSAIGCMTEATTTLTRAGPLRAVASEAEGLPIFARCKSMPPEASAAAWL